MNETCSKCRSAIRVGAAFCTRCGSRHQANVALPATPMRPNQSATTTDAPRSVRNQLRPMPIALETSVLLILVLVFWQFLVGLAYGLRGVNPDSSLPRQTRTAPELQPPTVPATTSIPQPMMVTNPDQPADETYVLPRTNKSSSNIDSEYVMDMQRAAQALNTHDDLGPLSTPQQ